MNLNNFLTADYIAKELQVDPSTVRRWLRDGAIPYSKFGRAVRVKAKDFEDFCKQKQIG